MIFRAQSHRSLGEKVATDKDQDCDILLANDLIGRDSEDTAA